MPVVEDNGPGFPAANVGSSADQAALAPTIKDKDWEKLIGQREATGNS